VIFNRFAKYIWERIVNPLYGHLILSEKIINKRERYLNVFEESCEIHNEGSCNEACSIDVKVD